MRNISPTDLRTSFRIRCFAARAVVLFIVLAVCPAIVHAAEATVESQNPAPINGFDIEGGLKFDYRSGHSDESYYRISYAGSLIKSQGTPFKYAKHVSLTEPGLKNGEGDENRWRLRLENGTLAAEGGLFEVQSVSPINLRGLHKADLRGVALLAGDSDLENIEAAVGIESPPFRVPGFQDTQWSNWAIFGVNAQKHEDTESADDESFGLFTYRGFLGKAFDWHKSADVGETAAKIEQEILDQAPTYTAANELFATVDAIPVEERTQLQRLFRSMFQEAEGEEDWAATVRDIALGRAQAITDQPTWAVYVQNSGYYTFSGDPQGGKLKNLLTATIDYWFLPTRDDAFLRLRYENGFERAVPTERKNQLMLSVVLRL